MRGLMSRPNMLASASQFTLSAQHHFLACDIITCKGAVNTPSGVAFAARRTHPSSASGVIRPGSSRPPDAPTASGATTPGTPAAPNACDDCLEEGGAYRAAVIGQGRKVPLFLLRFQRGRHGGVRGYLTPTPRGRGD
ncbi:hypothetical protein GWK47_006880 [Chionoecetes opilio]|uniref:Uncharacterized protein n=1 Tax=Chionoecetes opilio TaxID=41210 RepID=A0A8J4Y483_CHIOP|nr:hypothetical protein GWK47_006880 [Chionoecetes opilio]